MAVLHGAFDFQFFCTNLTDRVDDQAEDDVNMELVGSIWSSSLRGGPLQPLCALEDRSKSVGGGRGGFKRHASVTGGSPRILAVLARIPSVNCRFHPIKTFVLPSYSLLSFENP